MPKSIAFNLCRYSISQFEGDAPLSSSEQFALLDEVKGKTIAYRKREPTASDETTFLFRPRQQNIAGRDVLTWIVADQVGSRVRMKYRQDIDDREEELSSTDEIKITRFVAVPSLYALAIDDRAGDKYLGSRSAAGRFKALMSQLATTTAVIHFAGSSQDVERALSTWALDHFVFTVRPSNPHPPKLGEKLDELMKADGVGKFHGTASPLEQSSMRVSANGIIREVTGLSDAGYGQYGARGITPNGLEATLSSPTFDMSKDKNIKRQTESRMLKIHIDEKDSLEEEDAQIVNALADLYGAIA